jgi:hypothetical protein
MSQNKYTSSDSEENDHGSESGFETSDPSDDEDDEGRNTQHNTQRFAISQDLSSVTTDGESERLNKIYQNNIMEELNENTRDMVRQEIKKRIWPYTKFTTLELVKGVDLNEEGTFLYEVLVGLNRLRSSKCDKLMFWNRYGREVVEVLTNLKCNVGTGVKGAVVKGNWIRITILFFFTQTMIYQKMFVSNKNL